MGGDDSICTFVLVRQVNCAPSFVGTPSLTPRKMRVAMAMSGRSRHLDTKGKEREARTLHSITCVSAFELLVYEALSY